MNTPSSKFITVLRQYEAGSRYYDTFPCVLNRDHIVCATNRDGATEVKTVSDEYLVFKEPSFDDFIADLTGSEPDKELLTYLDEKKKKEHEKGMKEHLGALRECEEHEKWCEEQEQLVRKG